MAKKKKTSSGDPAFQDILDISFSEEFQRRYLNYALSVISSRALPDVRDGLKPVQRRILYTMWNELKLRSDAKPRKCAAIVGDVMGKFHPHGDGAIYDALVRVAQPFTLRKPLVYGRGNFGSPDGDAAAAMRYTEARLTALSDELLSELPKQTVDYRPNYDGTRFEPVVLPARFPNLLVNGSQGIAVGMATSIPPHHLGEVVNALVRLIDDPTLSLKQILRTIKGPDFPTGGQIVSSKADLLSIYETGSGSIKLRGEWEVEEGSGRGKKGDPKLVITSIPYAIERRAIVEKIGDAVRTKKLPQVVDVRDESSDVTRIVCDLKKGTDPAMVAAFLYKNTPLQTNISFNLTCLVPTGKGDAVAPRRCDLLTILKQFLSFRMDVVTRRLEFDLKKLLERIHILEGFVKIFDALDETIRIIRRSNDKKDAAQKLIKRFELSDLQVDAILELRLHRLAKLQILLIREELAEKKKEAARIQKLLKSETARWQLIRAELHELGQKYAEGRRSKVLKSISEEPEFDADAFIVDEDAMVVLSRQGWVKRQQKVRDVSTTRVRENDSVLEVIAGSTKSSVAFFSSLGACYVMKVVDIPQTTGYGVPMQSIFKLKDGEKIVAMMGFDPRYLEVPPPNEDAEEPEGPYAIAVTRLGMSLRFSLRGHRDVSTRNGRKYARLGKDDEIIYVGWVDDGECIACVSEQRRALVCFSEEVSLLSGAGKGVKLIKLAPGDYLIGAKVLIDDLDALTVKRKGGTEYRITTRKYEPVSRAGKGFQLFQRGSVESVVLQDPTLPGIPAPSDD